MAQTSQQEAQAAVDRAQRTLSAVEDRWPSVQRVVDLIQRLTAPPAPGASR